MVSRVPPWRADRARWATRGRVGSLVALLLLSALSAPGVGAFSSTLRTLPATTYLVSFTMDPSGCGPITFNNTLQADGSSANFIPGSYTAIAHPCTGYTFQQWNTTGEVKTLTASEATSTIQVLGAGSLLAWYVVAIPEYSISFGISPAACGPITFDSTPLSNGTSADYQAGTYPVQISSCPGFTFVQWNVSGSVTVASAETDSTTAQVTGAGTLEAWFISSSHPTPLSATASGSPLSGAAPLMVAFSSTVQGGTAPYTYSWSFGDGSTPSTVPNPSHTYAAAGSYPVELTVTDSASSTTHAFLNVSAITPLTVSLKAAPSLPTVGDQVYVNASVQGGISPYNYAWSGIPNGCSGTSGPDLQCTATAIGVLALELRVTDAAGTTTSAWTNVTVEAAPTQTPPSTSGGTIFGMPPTGFVYLLVGMAVGAFAVLGLLLLLRRRFGRPSPPGEVDPRYVAPPPPPPTPPPG